MKPAKLGVPPAKKPMAAAPLSRGPVPPKTAKSQPSEGPPPVRKPAEAAKQVSAKPASQFESASPGKQLAQAPAASVASAKKPAAEARHAPSPPPEPVAAKPPSPRAPEQVARVAPKLPGPMPGMHGRPQIVPRTPAAKETFVEGDHVVYPTHGVGKVERIATEEIAGHKLELIHITFEENRMTLRVPVSKARSAGLRKLATRKQFDDALALLKGRARIKRTMWSRRAQEYDAKINSGDPMAIAEVVRDLHRNAGQPDQSFSERQIYEAAMDRLAAEMGALDKTDKATAAQKLADYLKSITKSAAAAEPEIEEAE